jgi:ABC-type branched-subunit amino acid transport system ATPase component
MLEIRNLDVVYGYAKILHDVSLTLESGQMAFVIGRNGAGKTTLLRTIAGVLKPAGGSIEYQGQQVGGRRPEELAIRGIRYVAQEKKVFGNLTVRENIELAAHGVGEPLDQAIERVTMLYPKLSKFMETKAGQLSGGQRQILLVGRALVGDPRLLLIDEPTQGLATIVIDEICRILEELKGRVSALIVEQNLAMVKHLADCVYVIREGKISRKITERDEISDTAKLEEFV